MKRNFVSSDPRRIIEYFSRIWPTMFFCIFSIFSFKSTPSLYLYNPLRCHCDPSNHPSATPPPPFIRISKPSTTAPPPPLIIIIISRFNRKQQIHDRIATLLRGQTPPCCWLTLSSDDHFFMPLFSASVVSLSCMTRDMASSF